MKERKKKENGMESEKEMEVRENGEEWERGEKCRGETDGREPTEWEKVERIEKNGEEREG